MHDFIVNYMREHHDAEFDPEIDDLADWLDSVSVFQLNSAIEQSLGITVPPGEQSIDDYATVDSLVALLQRFQKPVAV